MTPKVSIVVPCYKVEKYLNRCVESLTSQSLQDIEIVLVDDGSPDNVPRMCDKWREKDPRIKVVHKKNAGLGFARNSGLAEATGEYVTFVDSDDYVNPNAYEHLYNVAKEKSADIVFFGMEKEYKPNCYVNVRGTESFKEVDDEEVKKMIPDFIASEPYQKSEYKYEMSVCSAFYRKSVISGNNLQFVSEREFVSEDLLFQIDVLNCSKKAVFISDVFYHYCWNEGSLTKTISKEKFAKTKALFFALRDKSKNCDPYALRSKRLFIGYVRSFIRILVNMQLPFHTKKQEIKNILEDDIWEEIKSYKPSFLPIHQRVFLMLFYSRSVYMTYYYAKLMNFLKLKGTFRRFCKIISKDKSMF